MTSRPNTLETLHLALELLRRIPRSGKVSASQLHAQLLDAGLQRDLRSIQRQLEMLTLHFDIECDDRQRPYGYRWKERAKGLSLPTLSVQESLLLSLAEEHLRNLLPASLMRSLEGYFDQARANLGPGTNAGREREWLKKVRVVSTTQPLLPPKIKPEVFAEVSNALYGNCWLEVHYRNAGGKSSTSDVMPLGLAQQGPRLYLVCRYRNFDDERSLALHRILSARATTLTFPRPQDFDLQAYDADGQFGFGAGERIRLSFCIDRGAGYHLLESPLSKDQVVRDCEEYYEITATVVDSAQLRWWLRGFGDDVWDVSIEL